jgi:hypothetical protein
VVEARWKGKKGLRQVQERDLLVDEHKRIKKNEKNKNRNKIITKQHYTENKKE